MKRRLLALTAMSAISAALSYLLLSGDNPGPRPWPQGHVIAYYNASGWRATLTEAVEQWNRLDFGVRFAPTRKRTEADLIITDSKLPCDGTCRGLATGIGYYGPATRDKIYLLPAPPSEDARHPTSSYVQTIVHELGHTLGLRHTLSDCSVMYSGSRTCKDQQLQVHGTLVSMPCGPWRSDVDQLAELYQLTAPRSVHTTCSWSLRNPAVTKVLGLQTDQFGNVLGQSNPGHGVGPSGPLLLSDAR